MRRDPTQFRERFKRYKEGKLVYQAGRPVDDEVSYREAMKNVARENYKDWGYKSPADAWQDLVNNPTYNYRAYYTDPQFYQQSGGNVKEHWPDKYKTPFHETFSNESVYSGKQSKENPYGLRGGQWVGDKFIPAAWQRRINPRTNNSKYPKFKDGDQPNITRVYRPYYDTDGTLIRNVDVTLPEVTVTNDIHHKDWSTHRDINPTLQPDYRSQYQRKSDLAEAQHAANLYYAAKDDAKAAEGFDRLMKLTAPSTYGEAITGKNFGTAGRLAFDVAAFGLPGLTKRGMLVAVRSAKDRAATAIYRNVAPASYKDSYLPGGKKEEVFNAVKDFITPKKLKLTNERYKDWLKETTSGFGTITPSSHARDEIYKMYLGLPTNNIYYSPTQIDGVFTHDLRNTQLEDVLRSIQQAYQKDPEMSGRLTLGNDFMNSAGGNIGQSITRVGPDDAVYLYRDIWDVNPFQDANRLGNVLPKKIIDRYTHKKNVYGFEKTVWNENTPWFINKLKNFELSSLTNGGPVPVETNINLKLLRPEMHSKIIKKSDSEIIQRIADTDLDMLLEYMTDCGYYPTNLEYKKMKNEAFTRAIDAFLKMPERYRKLNIYYTPHSDRTLYDKYGYFLRYNEQ